MRGTWLPSPITRPQIPDRTKRIDGPRCEYEYFLNEVINSTFILNFQIQLTFFDNIYNEYLLNYCFQQLPIEDLDIFFYPPPLDDVNEYKCTFEEQKIKACELAKSKS